MHNHVNVFIYIQSGVKPEAIASMASGISQLAGVAKAGVSARVNRLLAVEYDPHCTSASALLDVVERNGCHGALVGM